MSKLTLIYFLNLNGYVDIPGIVYVLKEIGMEVSKVALCNHACFTTFLKLKSAQGDLWSRIKCRGVKAPSGWSVVLKNYQIVGT